MITELLKEKYLDKEIEIYLNGHIFYHPKNSKFYDGKRESTRWELTPSNEIDNSANPDISGCWSKFRCIRKKIVKVVEVIHHLDYEINEWRLRCVGKKGKEYIIPIPE